VTEQSNDQAAFTATIKFGTDFRDPWLVVRADSASDLSVRLDEATAALNQLVAETAADAIGKWTEVKRLVANPGVAVARVADAVGGTLYHAPENEQQAYGAAPAQAAPAGSGPVCVHGPMVARSGGGAGTGKRAWSGHFCPTPKGTVGQCAPQFAKD
jgi:hypothetical protein